MSLTKADLVTILNEQAGLSKEESISAIEATFDIIKAELASGNEVEMSSFGKWTILNKKERNGRNPQTGKNITITARKVVSFKRSLILKNKLNDE